MKHCLTIAGSDCSGGAGLQADLKTFAAHGVYGMSVVTAVVAENTCRVLSVQDLPSGCIADQLDTVFEDIPVDAVKIGMLSGRETMETVVDKLREYCPAHVVIDPVMVATSGDDLMQREALGYFKEHLLPLAAVLTPNLPEAEALLGKPVHTLQEMEEAAKTLCHMGAKAALVKGGHLDGEALDVLFDGQKISHFTHARIPSSSTHGTGCTLSSAIAANLALGFDVGQAVANAKEYVSNAIQYALSVGKGHGPTNHLYEFYQLKGWL